MRAAWVRLCRAFSLLSLAAGLGACVPPQIRTRPAAVRFTAAPGRAPRHRCRRPPDGGWRSCCR